MLMYDAALPLPIIMYYGGVVIQVLHAYAHHQDETPTTFNIAVAAIIFKIWRTAGCDLFLQLLVGIAAAKVALERLTIGQAKTSFPFMHHTAVYVHTGRALSCTWEVLFVGARLPINTQLKNSTVVSASPTSSESNLSVMGSMNGMPTSRSSDRKCQDSCPLPSEQLRITE